MATLPAWDFTVAEAGIVAWIKAKAQTGDAAWARFVGTRKELAAVAEEMQKAPAVYVVYDGFVVASSNEYEALLAHRWFIVLALANAGSQREAEPLNDAAGPLMKQLFDLFGYTPPGCSSPLVPVTPPRPYFSPAKFAYYPLAFTTQSHHCASFMH